MTEPSSGARRPICFAGPLPPPFHGMAAVNVAVVERLRSQASVVALNAAPGMRRTRVRHHVAKASRALGILARIAGARMAGANTHYGSVDDGLGGVITAAFALMARLCGFRLYLHHHSFRYLDRRRWTMALVTTVAGRGCCHVVLCEVMEAKLKRLYPQVTRTMVVPNPVPQPATLPQDDAKHAPGSPIVIGLLSNLMFEKGVAEFIAIVEQARAKGINAQGILAGPAWTPAEEACIEAAIARNSESLCWVGPVSGEAKERFFAEIDVFVFPTKYPSEAYPLVLVEALIRGRPVIAPERGSIGSLRPLASATIIDIGADFVEAAVSQLAFWASTADRALATGQARAEGAALNAANHAARERLIESILLE